MDMERLLTALTVRWGAAESSRWAPASPSRRRGAASWTPSCSGTTTRSASARPTATASPRTSSDTGSGTGARRSSRAGPRGSGSTTRRLFVKWRAAASEDGRSAQPQGRRLAPRAGESRRTRSANVALMGLARLGWARGTSTACWACRRRVPRPSWEPCYGTDRVPSRSPIERSLGSSAGRGAPVSDLDAAAARLRAPRAGRSGEQHRLRAGGPLGVKRGAGTRLPGGSPGGHASHRLHAGRAGESIKALAALAEPHRPCPRERAAGRRRGGPLPRRLPPPTAITTSCSPDARR
jgi:hypothetical protein